MSGSNAAPTEIDTDDDAATTDLDASSPSSEVEIVAVRPASVGGEEPALVGARVAVDRVRAACQHELAIGWRLQAVDERDALGHVVECVDQCLRTWNVFKIGITYVPLRRWEIYRSCSAPCLPLVGVFRCCVVRHVVCLFVCLLLSCCLVAGPFCVLSVLLLF